MAEGVLSPSFLGYCLPKITLEWYHKLVGIKRNLAFDSIDGIEVTQGIYFGY